MGFMRWVLYVFLGGFHDAFHKKQEQRMKNGRRERGKKKGKLVQLTILNENGKWDK